MSRIFLMSCCAALGVWTSAYAQMMPVKVGEVAPVKREVFATHGNPGLSKTYDLAKSSEELAAQQLERTKGLSHKKLVSQKDLPSSAARRIEATQSTLCPKLHFEKSEFKVPAGASFVSKNVNRN